MGVTIVTGANRGIGLELAKQLKAKGHEVIGACRSSSNALEALGIRIETLDVADGDSIQQFADRIGDTEISLLVNNAGVLSKETLDDLDVDGIRKQFEVNALGPLRVTGALRKSLAKGGKVAIVTSRMGSVADNTSGSMYGYRMSKAAVNMAGMSLSHDLADDDVSVVLLHPGFVKTGMTNHNGHVEPAAAAAGLIERIDALDRSTSGSFFHADGSKLPW